MLIGSKLKKIREDNGLTIDELVERLNKYEGINLSKGTVSNWENNKREPKNTFIAAYAKEFNVDMNYLLDIYGNVNRGTEFMAMKSPSSSYTIPFINAAEARSFLKNQGAVMGFDGLDVTKFSDEEIIDYANDMIEMMKLVTLKYKK